MFNVNKVRADFPILSREVYGKPLVYLDNGATTQKPRQVVEAMVDEYYNVNANVHRGVHFLSQQATDLHEASREVVRPRTQHQRNHLHTRHNRKHQPARLLIGRSHGEGRRRGGG